MEMTSPLSDSANLSTPTTARRHRSKPKIIYEKQLSSAKLKTLLKRVLIFHASLIIGSTVIHKIGGYFSSHVNGYQQGNLRRIASIFALEWGMAHLSLIIYLHLFSAFEKAPFMSPKYLIRCKNERLRLYCLLGFGLIILLAHLNYMFYLVNTFEVPPFLYDLSAISNGIWIHLCLLSYGFTALNIGLKIISAFQIGRRFLDRLFQFRAIKLFCNNPRFQVGLTLLLTAVLSLSHWYSSDKLVVRHQKIHLTRETQTNQLLKVAVLTDLHAGAAIYAEQIAKVVERVNELKDLDAIFLIGDVIDAPRKLIEDRVESLRHLRSRLGTFYVTGNHEYYYGNVDEWFELFDAYGIRILKNRAVNLKGYCLVGLNDVFSGKSGIHNHKMDVHAIKACPRNESSIVLAHNPMAADEIMEYSKNSSHPVDLILSGHTHAGQYYLLFPLGHLIFRYFYGLYSLDNGTSQILVSAGTLFQGAPMKMPFMAEIWQLEILPATN